MQNIRARSFYILMVLFREMYVLIFFNLVYCFKTLINSTVKSGNNGTKAASRISGLFLLYCPLVTLVRFLKIKLISHFNSAAAFSWI